MDLFVGVASVGNDPTWQDGGPDHRYRTYWPSWSFGDFSATAQTRKQLLERLMPRLVIASCCSIEGRFLTIIDLERYLLTVPLLSSQIEAVIDAQLPMTLKKTEACGSRTHQGPRRAAPQPF